MAWVYWFAAIFWARLIYFFSSIPGISTGLGFWDFILRKCAHMFEFAYLCILLVLGLRKTFDISHSKTFFLAGFASLLYAASDEFHQTFVANRDGNLGDILIDSAGILIAILFIEKGGLCEGSSQET
ncbi:MAG: VanZ family protein [Elusimicrobia bacterium]|nr:VanZ family protein [Elusimicrobiota bacterium]